MGVDLAEWLGAMDRAHAATVPPEHGGLSSSLRFASSYRTPEEAPES